MAPFISVARICPGSRWFAEMAVRAAGPVTVAFPGGDVVVVGAVCALAFAIVATIITAKAAVIVGLNISFPPQDIGRRSFFQRVHIWRGSGPISEGLVQCKVSGRSMEHLHMEDVESLGALYS